MNREIFVMAIKKLLQLQANENIKKWVVWAEECVDNKQYDGFGEMPRIAAIEKWLDSYYLAFKNIYTEFGREPTIKVLNLSQERLCLYPFEMWSAAHTLNDSGTATDILQMIDEGTLSVDTIKTKFIKEPQSVDNLTYSKRDLLNILKFAKTWQDDPEIPILYKPVDSLATQLLNDCMELLQYNYDITTIQKSDYDLISEHAFFLVNSNQVLEPADIDLDAIYECFNDAKINERMIEVEERIELTKKSMESEKKEKSDRKETR